MLLTLKSKQGHPCNIGVKVQTINHNILLMEFGWGPLLSLSLPHILLSPVKYILIWIAVNAFFKMLFKYAYIGFLIILIFHNLSTVGRVAFYTEAVN